MIGDLLFGQQIAGVVADGRDVAKITLEAGNGAKICCVAAQNSFPDTLEGAADALKSQAARFPIVFVTAS